MQTLTSIALSAPLVALAQGLAWTAHGAEASLHVVVDDLRVDAESLRDRLETELQRPIVVGAPPRSGPTLSLTRTWDGQVRLRFEALGEAPRERTVELPGSEAESLRVLTLIAANLVQSESREILGMLGPPSTPAAEGEAPAPPLLQPVPFAIDLAPGVGVSSLQLGRDRRRLSLGVFGSWAGAIDGFSASSLFDLSTNEVEGVQLAGLVTTAIGPLHGLSGAGIASVVGGDVDGAQLAGLLSGNVGKVEGAQLAGVLSAAVGEVEGAQLAGVLSAAAADFQGAQLAPVSVAAGFFDGLQASVVGVTSESHAGAQLGVVAVTGRDFDGLQASVVGVIGGTTLTGAQIGTLNVAGGDVDGAQVGVVNVAGGAVSGTQVGVINVADDTDTGGIGVLSFYARGRTQLRAGVDADGFARTEVVHGGRLTHNVLSAGISPFGEGRFRVGLGFGARVFSKGPIYVDLDLSAHNLFPLSDSSFQPDLVPEFRALLGGRISEHVGMYGGVSYHVQISWRDTPLELGEFLTSRRSDADPFVEAAPGFFLGFETLAL